MTALEMTLAESLCEFIADITGPVIGPLLREEARSNLFLNRKRLSLERTTQQ